MDSDGNPTYYSLSQETFARLDRSSARDAEREPRRLTLIAKPPEHVEAAELDLDAADIADLDAESEATRRERAWDAYEDACDQRYDQMRDDALIGGES